MAYTLQQGGYVKFLRGTLAAWNSLETKDKDTLYFISEKGATKGSLYLGSKLISSADFTQISTINEIEDILISEGVVDGSLLVYDEKTEKWVNKSVPEVLASATDIMVGATKYKDGVSGLVPVPLQGEQDKFLKADGTWADTGVAQLQTKLNSLIGEDTNKTIRAIAAEEVSAIVDEAPEAFDTLKEIATWIQSQPSTESIVKMENTVSQLETIINGVEDKTIVGEDGSEQVIPGTEGLVAKVASLDALLNTPDTGIVDRVTTIENNYEQIVDALKWQDLVEE